MSRYLSLSLSLSIYIYIYTRIYTYILYWFLPFDPYCPACFLQWCIVLYMLSLESYSSVCFIFCYVVMFSICAISWDRAWLVCVCMCVCVCLCMRLPQATCFVVFACSTFSVSRVWQSRVPHGVFRSACHTSRVRTPRPGPRCHVVAQIWPTVKCL